MPLAASREKCSFGRYLAVDETFVDGLACERESSVR